LCCMARKTLTISEKAYNALARMKSKDESFTKVILRLAQRKSKGNLLDYVRSFPPDNELADRIEEVLEKRGSIRIRASSRPREVAEEKGVKAGELVNVDIRKTRKSFFGGARGIGPFTVKDEMKDHD